MQSHIILLVEDSDDDVFFMHYALKKAGISYPVHLAADGQEAVDYLTGTGKYSDRQAFPIPTLILLDLKLPFLSGFEVLAWMREQPTVRHVPVFILTGSSEACDKEKARELGAKGYFVKPPNEAMIHQIMGSLDSESALAAASAGLQASEVSRA